MGVLLVFFGPAFRAGLRKKDGPKIVHSEEIRIAKEHDEVHKLAGGFQGDASGLEMKALALLAGAPRLLEIFLQLTDHVSMGAEWDPLEEAIQWERWRRLSAEEIGKLPAVRVLRDRGYYGGVLPAAFGGYAIIASDKAMAMRHREGARWRYSR